MKYQLLPPLSAEEYQSLERSIVEHGVLVPVEYDEDGNILDGHHRVQICESLGLVDWPRFVRKGLAETDKRKLARELNISRRHLTTAQKQAVIADQLRDTPSISSRAIAAMLGVDHKTVSAQRERLVATGEIPQFDETTGQDGKARPTHRTIKTAFVPEPQNQREYLRGAKDIRAVRQKVSHAVRLAHLDLIAEKGAASAPVWWQGEDASGPTYPIVYADPPWRHERWSMETGSEKSAENHYPTMTLDEIVALGCPATKNAALFLWVTSLANGLRVLEAWGFRFVSFWVWRKVYPGEGFGTGYWSFDNAEILMIGTRGDFPAPLPGTQPVKCTDHPVGPHSRKPEWYAGEIQRLWPDVPKLEMFQRKASLAPGDVRLNGEWSFWGFDAGGDVPAEPDEQVAA